jgi:hypothetical protein
LAQNINFSYDGNAIEIVNEFTYLGLNFSRTGSFTNAKKVLINKAYKAMYFKFPDVTVLTKNI